MKVTMIILGIASLLVAFFYMSGIFSSLNILLQTQLGHYIYHPTLTRTRTTQKGDGIQWLYSRFRFFKHNY